MSDSPYMQRVYYSEGELLEAKDFIAEQGYFRDMSLQHNSSIFYPGVTSGLWLYFIQADEESFTVCLSPGMALDKYGNQLILTEEAVIKVPVIQFFSTNYGSYVTISFNQIEANKRIIEEPAVGLVATALDAVFLMPDNTTQIILGLIKSASFFTADDPQSSLADALDRHVIDPKLSEGFRDKGANLAPSSQVYTVKKGSQWAMMDPIAGKVYLAKKAGGTGGGGTLVIYQITVDYSDRGICRLAVSGAPAVFFESGYDALENGQQTVKVPGLDPDTGARDAIVMATPYFTNGGNDLKPLAVSPVDKDGQFTVKAIGGGNSSQKFYWEVALKSAHGFVDRLGSLETRFSQFESQVSANEKRFNLFTSGTVMGYPGAVKLFDIAPDMSTELNNPGGEVSDKLRKEFKSKGSVEFSQKATVFIVQPGIVWQVADDAMIYFVKKEAGQLNVYGDIDPSKVNLKTLNEKITDQTRRLDAVIGGTEGVSLDTVKDLLLYQESGSGPVFQALDTAG